MGYYQKRGPIVNAQQYDGTQRCLDLMRVKAHGAVTTITDQTADPPRKDLIVKTASGDAPLLPGCWVVHDLDGFHVYPDDAFKATYVEAPIGEEF